MSLTITTTLSLSSQSVANNTSTVTWKVKYSKSSSTYNNNGAKYYVNVDGNRVKSGTWKPKKGTTSGTIASGTTTIKHNADGTHAQIRAYAKVYDTGFSPSSADDYSPYLSLPTIVRTYTVSYNANGGSGAPASQTKTYGVNLTLSSTVPTRAGYAFKGWATSSTGAVAYQAGGTYSANSAVTLYAVWELLGNVKIESYSAFRCDSSGNAADEGTYGKFTCTYILSGQGANEGSVTARYRASDVSTWTNITNISHGNHSKPANTPSLSVNVSCLISNLSQDESYLIELTVTDSYGNTAIASDYISQAYFTMDFLAGGKGIGIGTTASCDESKHPNGLLTCAMDADFKGELTLGTALSIANGGTGATTAAAARTNLEVKKYTTKNFTSSSQSVSANTYKNISFSIGLDGYKPLGIIGINHGVFELAVIRFSYGADSASVVLRNVTSNAKKVSVTITVLYEEV